MEYTTLDAVKAVLDAQEATDDDELGDAIDAASRTIDRYCTGVDDPESDNYFELSTVTDEVIQGQVDALGRIVCWPRKPKVASVSAFAYRASPLDSWVTVDSAYLEIKSGAVLAWLSLQKRRELQVKLTYSGGFAVVPTGLPADLRKAATTMAVRLYKEDKTGLSDAIGVAELTGGQGFLYTKAMPVRVKVTLAPFRRIVPW